MRKSKLRPDEDGHSDLISQRDKRHGQLEAAGSAGFKPSQNVFLTIQYKTVLPILEVKLYLLPPHHDSTKEASAEKLRIREGEAESAGSDTHKSHGSWENYINQD
ncbi:hypothetical protein RRG08_024428 [Elysia crispata]|uniref:Uncharacterized protein n=1 Tax=Elysia crispata TaxID=231223 RepID=A0AAE1D268_9GAST|nr:hypothetical protein RRG08_024428 [Elysia crispata]